jgi:glycosyltransferase involved in cell wall biosynthesis
MRVMHVIDSAGFYGAEAVVLNLAAEQSRLGTHSIVLSVGNKRAPEKAIESEAKRRDIACIPFRMSDGPNLLGAWQIARLARHHRIDVLHSHNYKSNILLGLMPRFLRRIPLITTLHGWTAAVGPARFSRMGLYCYLDQKVLPALDAVVTVNPELLRTSAVERLPPSRVHTITNGIPLSVPPPLAIDDPLRQLLQTMSREGCVILGAIGRLSEEKNFSALIDAVGQLATRHANLRLVIAGAGPQAEQLAQQVRTLGLAGRVVLQGYVQNASRYLPLFDALTIPSLTEGLPMVLLEAMAAGTTVIASPVGGIPSTLNGLGILIDGPSLNGAAIAGAIEQFIGDRPSFAAKAALARSRVENEYSASAMAQRYQVVYESVVKQYAGT